MTTITKYLPLIAGIAILAVCAAGLLVGQTHTTQNAPGVVSGAIEYSTMTDTTYGVTSLPSDYRAAPPEGIDDIIARWDEYGKDYVHPLNFQGLYAERLSFLQKMAAGMNRRAAIRYTRIVDSIYLNWTRPGYDRTKHPRPAFAMKVERHDDELWAQMVSSKERVMAERVLPWNVEGPVVAPDGTAVLGRRVAKGWYSIGAGDTTSEGDTTDLNGVRLTHTRASPFASFWLSDERLNLSFPHLAQ